MTMKAKQLQLFGSAMPGLSITFPETLVFRRKNELASVVTNGSVHSVYLNGMTRIRTATLTGAIAKLEYIGFRLDMEETRKTWK